jgi:regulator of protease activity HflC (stomatin/prohibitin superfamily)
MLLGILTASLKQIDAGYVGVKSLFGKVQPDILNSGLNFYQPFGRGKELDAKTLIIP